MNYETTHARPSTLVLEVLRKGAARCCLALLCLISTLPLAAAQNAPTSSAADQSVSLTPVVVTATRRAESQQTVPISLVAYSQKQLDAMSITSMDDVARVSPAITFQRNGTSPSGNYNDEDSDIDIRGIESTAGAATTAIYIDDTPIQSRHIGYGTQNAYPAVFDLQRIEVLRGPQGSLFGASAEGGAVRFIDTAPSFDDSSGYVKSQLETTENGAPGYEVGAAGGGPLIDNVLAFRASASEQFDGGWVNRVNPTTMQVLDPNSNSQQTTTFRVALGWRPMDGLTITPSVYYQKLQNNDTGSYWLQLSNPSDEDFNNGNAGPVNSVDPFYITAIRVEWRLPWAQLVSNTSYYSRNQHGNSEYTELMQEIYFDSTSLYPGAFANAYLTDNQKNFYQEVRLESPSGTSRLSWIAGIYYTHSREDSIEDIRDSTINAESGGALCAQLACPNGLFYSEPYDWVLDKQLAGYADVDFKITDTLKATVGARVSHDIVDGASYISGPFFGPAVASQGSTSETPVTPKYVLSYQPSASHLIYLSAAKGFRPGGVNSSVGSACAANLTLLGLSQEPAFYKSDSLWSYELGTKDTFWDQRLQIDASAFDIDWKDIQQDVYLGECGLSYVANLGKVRSSGGDIALQIRPTNSLLMSLTAAYTDAKYTETECATTAVACSGPNAITAPVATAGDRPPVAPWTGVVMVEYDLPWMVQKRPYFNATYTYSSAQNGLTPYQDARNALSDPTIAPFTQSADLSLRGGLRWNGIDASLFASNVLDQHPVLFQGRDFAAPYVTLYRDHGVRPRTVGVTATYNF